VTSVIDAAQSVPSLQFKTPAHPLDIRLQNVSAWTQHITSRPPSHWLAPRRHGVHNGKSTAEIGMLTTICTRDYVAACNSCLGICQAEERISRLNVEREHRSFLASLFQQFVFASRPRLPPSTDPLLLLSVAEVESREDILEEEALNLDWLVARDVILPTEISVAEAQQSEAIRKLLDVLRQREELRMKMLTNVEPAGFATQLDQAPQWLRAVIADANAFDGEFV
jgi:hypothetical protein